ncbi:4Fe-4S dicluster domain-containing protein [candidate division CSSED10-310 bacterium]|uniref:Electron transfer flavoprotein-ubiquinone oxidoreductase n=1 Tax=candidate division CSSED10-310 bacterium TaxID=2855610 RepID=A0ABV6YW81_UNCC1
MTEERENFPVDVLFVGAGPSNLSAALHLVKLIDKHNESIDKGEKQGQKLDEVAIALIEKGAEIGSHAFSGAVLDPVALKKLVPDFKEKECPLESEVTTDAVYYLTPKGRKFKLPITPPPLQNHGNYVISLSKFTRWLGNLIEETEKVDIFPGFAGVELLYEDNKIVGVCTGDKGIDADGSKKSNFEPGYDITAKVTVLGDGPRGNLTKKLFKKFNSQSKMLPLLYETGVKEVLEMPEGKVTPGMVIHTMGYPLKKDTFGGTFIYGMSNNMLSIGLVVACDYHDPLMDPHLELQKLKTHPFIKDVIDGGKPVYYGGKTLAAGGYYSIPQLAYDGCLVVGDAAGLLNAQRLKGIHLAMLSGIEAAETIFQCLVSDDFSEKNLAAYAKKVKEGPIGQELKKVRNFHQAMSKGLYKGMFHAGLQFITKGRGLKDPMLVGEDYENLQSVKLYYGLQGPPKDQGLKFDNVFLMDKLTDVYNSGTKHEEKQPSHLIIHDPEICAEKCIPRYDAPCTRFCPAQVYELETNEATNEKFIKVNFSNCVHCKTCDLKDPYENITWNCPEGGGGPEYSVT